MADLSACPGHIEVSLAILGQADPPLPSPHSIPGQRGPHRDMQLRKSLSCVASGSAFGLLLVLTRILAFLALSSEPVGSETGRGHPPWAAGASGERGGKGCPLPGPLPTCIPKASEWPPRHVTSTRCIWAPSWSWVSTTGWV